MLIFHEIYQKIYPIIDDALVRGVSNLWSAVNHVAIVVSDVGRSLAFYTDVVGMKQVIRPNFDR